MTDCVFCKIIAGEIPSTIVYEDENVLAFKDINPQAPVHILVVPKNHITSIADIREDNSKQAARCLEAIAEIAEQEKLENGFRVITNCGEEAGQTVPHLHFHMLAGRKLSQKMV